MCKYARKLCLFETKFNSDSQSHVKHHNLVNTYLVLDKICLEKEPNKLNK